MKLLVLLTTSFPYDKGEDFLLSEVKQISGFEHILICPCNLKSDSVITKQIPNSISVHPIQKKDGGKISYIKLCFRPYVLSEAINLLFKGKAAFSRIHEALFFMKNAQSIYEGLCTIPEIQTADSITIYSYWFYDAAAAGILLSKKLYKQGKKVKLISRAHNFDIYSSRTKYSYLPMRRFLLNHINYLYPCSQNGADFITSQFPKYKDKIKPSFLGTEDHCIRLGKRKPEFHLVSCSFIAPVKRLHLIIEALKYVDFPLRWTHIGSGPIAQEVIEKSKHLPSQIQAEFLGQMDNAAIMEYYNSNDISAFVNVSSYEGIPVSIMEASSFGIPIIATDVGGTSEAVKDGVNGFLLDKDFEPVELKNIFQRLYDMKQENFDQLCENARNLWEEKFNAQKNYSNFYKEISR